MMSSATSFIGIDCGASCGLVMTRKSAVLSQTIEGCASKLFTVVTYCDLFLG